MSCLSGAVNDTTKPDSGRTDRADSCKFKYASGDICGAKTNHYKDLCDLHFKELNDIYESFVN